MDALTFRGQENAIAITGTAMAWYAIFNGMGRIVWGMISDRIGRLPAIIVMSAFQGIVMLAFVPRVHHFRSGYGLAGGASLVDSTTAAFSCCFRPLLPDDLGQQAGGRQLRLGVHRLMAWPGPLGPLLAGVFKDNAADGGSPIVWMAPFIIAEFACLIGAGDHGVYALLKKPATSAVPTASSHANASRRLLSAEGGDCEYSLAEPPLHHWLKAIFLLNMAITSVDNDIFMTLPSGKNARSLSFNSTIKSHHVTRQRPVFGRFRTIRTVPPILSH